MLQEYLFLNTENQKTIKDYKPKEASVRYIQWEKSDSWCVQYEISGENENVAKQLSEILAMLWNTISRPFLRMIALHILTKGFIR